MLARRLYPSLPSSVRSFQTYRYSLKQKFPRDVRTHHYFHQTTPSCGYRPWKRVEKELPASGPMGGLRKSALSPTLTITAPSFASYPRCKVHCWIPGTRAAPKARFSQSASLPNGKRSPFSVPFSSSFERNRSRRLMRDCPAWRTNSGPTGPPIGVPFHRGTATPRSIEPFSEFTEARTRRKSNYLGGNRDGTCKRTLPI